MAELFELTGVAQVLGRLQAYSVEALPLSVIELQQQADAILEASQPLVPVDTGSLQASGRVETPVLAGPVGEVTIRYGGSEGFQGRIPRNYAIRVHEDLSMNHPRGGQAKYLETAVLAATDAVVPGLAEALRLMF